MSLKAKIEAVIYASEEPVTLAQLTGLVGEEAQAELDALAAQQQSLALEAEPVEPAEDPDAQNAEVLTPEVLTPEALTPTEILASDRATEPSSSSGASSPAPENAEATEPSTDEKRLARDAAAEAKLRERKLREYFRSVLDQLVADYANGDRGLEIREVAGGFRLATKPEYHDAVRGFVKSLKPPLKLTLQALETLAVVAYKQPVTAPEVSEIRGVDSAGVLGSLMTRKLVTTAGRKQVIGRPILYKTTKDFLLRFGLKDINELPSIEEFEKMASELNETLLDQALETEDQALETEAQEEIPMEANGQTQHETSFEASHSGSSGSAPLDELNSAPEPSNIHHATPEDLLSDHSSNPHGRKHEPAGSSGREPMANMQSAQADGDPEDTDA